MLDVIFSGWCGFLGYDESVLIDNCILVVLEMVIASFLTLKAFLSMLEYDFRRGHSIIFVVVFNNPFISFRCLYNILLWSFT